MPAGSCCVVPARCRPWHSRALVAAGRGAMLAALLLGVIGCESGQWPPSDVTLWNPFQPKPAGPVKESKGGVTNSAGTTSFGSRRPTGRLLDDNPQAPTPEIDPTKTPERDDVTEIICFWGSAPWRVAQDEPVGFKAPVYFVSGTSGKGAFVPGTILAYLYEMVAASPGAKPQRRPIYGWELDRDQAMPFRVRKEAVGGNFYGFLLNWSNDIKVEGKTIELEFAYQGQDGRVITSSPKRFKVPIIGAPESVAADQQPSPLTGSSSIRPRREPTGDSSPPRTRPAQAASARQQATGASPARAEATSRPSAPPARRVAEPNYDPQVGP